MGRVKENTGRTETNVKVEKMFNVSGDNKRDNVLSARALNNMSAVIPAKPLPQKVAGSTGEKLRWSLAELVSRCKIPREGRRKKG